MNPSIKKLTEVAKKQTRTIIGLMSGTSLDGLDIALCEIKGSGVNTVVLLKRFLTKSYDGKTRKLLKRITSVQNVQLKEVSYWHTRLADMHAKMIAETLEEWQIKPDEIDCIASHGQTIYHYPGRDQLGKNPEKVNNTLQIGDGDHLATKTGIVTISDFRQKHTAHGGEGAPMAALIDRILFAHPANPRILLNIGGIANFTYLPSKKGSGEKFFTTDTGPGNTLIDNLTIHYFQKQFDKDGKIALSGTLNEELLAILLSDEWFAELKSKTTGPEYFNISWLHKKTIESGIDISEIPEEDIIRTASDLSARTIAENIKNHLSKDEFPTVYVSGGGAHNPYLMKRIGELLPDLQIKNFSDLGMDPDAKEAVIFAVLANEMLAGKGFEIETGDGKPKKLNFGKISFPV